MDSDVVQITTTTGSSEEAETVAHALLEHHLAACVQIFGPIRSLYRWQGEVERAQEWLCTAKTAAGRVDEAMAAIREVHSYDVPEIVVVPVIGGLDEYLGWVRQESGWSGPNSRVVE